MCRIEDQANFFSGPKKLWSELFHFFFILSELKLKHQARRSTICRLVEKTKKNLVSMT